MQTEIKGVGGWLGLLIFGLCLLGPLTSCGQLSNDFITTESANPTLAAMPQWIAFKSYSNWALGLALVVSLSAGYRLWKIHTPDSVRFAIGALWLVAPIAAIGYYAAAHFTFGDIGARAMGGDLVSMLIQGWLSALVWTLYLLKSRRVRNTYYQAASWGAS